MMRGKVHATRKHGKRGADLWAGNKGMQAIA